MRRHEYGLAFVFGLLAASTAGWASNGYCVAGRGQDADGDHVFDLRQLRVDGVSVEDPTWPRSLAGRFPTAESEVTAPVTLFDADERTFVLVLEQR